MRAATTRDVLAIALPAIATNMATALIGLVDAFVVGQMPGALPQAGTVLAVQFIGLLVFSFNFLQFGTVGLAARALGAGEAREAHAVLLRAMAVGGCIGLLLLALYPLLGRAGLAAYGAVPDVQHVAQQYADIRIFAVPLMLINMAMTGWLLAQQRPKRILMVEISYNLVNALLSVLLGLKAGYGVAGVAMASLIAEILKSCLLAFAVFRLAQSAHLKSASRWPVLLDRARLLATFSINRDLFVRTALLMLSLALFTSFGARQGAVTLAANGLLMQFASLSALMIDGFEVSAQTLCGRAMGARDGARFRALVARCLQLAFVLMLGLSLVWLLAGPHLIPLFTRTPAVAREAINTLPWLVMFVPLCWCFVLDGVFVGAGWTGLMLRTMMIAMTVYAAFLLLLPTANASLWAALLAFVLTRSLVQSYLYQREVTRLFPVSERTPVQ
jgi:multidrug resistance protein, MATE family